MIFGSDHVIEGVLVSHSALYDKTRNKETRRLVPLVNTVVGVIKEYHILNIDFNKIRFRLAPIKDMVEHFLGEFDHIERLVTLDCRLARPLFLSTLCHELVHAEQSFEKRLRINRKKRTYTWKGKTFSIPEAEQSTINASTSETSFREYINMPWEYEAHIRERKIGEEVLMHTAPTVTRQFLSYN